MWQVNISSIYNNLTNQNEKDIEGYKDWSVPSTSGSERKQVDSEERKRKRNEKKTALVFFFADRSVSAMSPLAVTEKEKMWP